MYIPDPFTLLVSCIYMDNTHTHINIHSTHTCTPVAAAVLVRQCLPHRFQFLRPLVCVYSHHSENMTHATHAHSSTYMSAIWETDQKYMCLCRCSRGYGCHSCVLAYACVHASQALFTIYQHTCCSSTLVAMSHINLCVIDCICLYVPSPIMII